MSITVHDVKPFRFVNKIQKLFISSFYLKLQIISFYESILMSITTILTSIEQHIALNFFKTFHGPNIDETGIPNNGVLLVSFES